jgi:hypothetical protein
MVPLELGNQPTTPVKGNWFFDCWELSIKGIHKPYPFPLVPSSKEKNIELNINPQHLRTTKHTNVYFGVLTRIGVDYRGHQLQNSQKQIDTNRQSSLRGIWSPHEYEGQMTTILGSYIPSVVDEGPHLILSLNSLFSSLCEPLGTW